MILSKIRIIIILLKYPGAKISFDSHIERNCKIICTDDSKLILKSVFISNGCHIFSYHGSTLEITKTFIGRNSVVIARNSIFIKENCQIAEMVVIRDQDHNFGSDTMAIAEQGFTSNPILIEENVWLACKVTVLAGSVIGKNSVVGAHSLVKGIVEENSLYVGIPATKKKSF